MKDDPVTSDPAKSGAAPGERAPHPAVRKASGSRYARGTPVGGLGLRASQSDDEALARAPLDAASPSYSSGRKNRIYSVVSALPVLMLVAGLALFYVKERAQSGGAPIAAESSVATGAHRGISVVRSGGQGQHFLWFDDVERGRRGVRLTAEQDRMLKPLLEDGDPLTLDVAPTVEGSTVRWVWRLRRGNEVLLDDSARLR